MDQRSETISQRLKEETYLVPTIKILDDMAHLLNRIVLLEAICQKFGIDPDIEIK